MIDMAMATGDGQCHLCPPGESGGAELRTLTSDESETLFYRTKKENVTELCFAHWNKFISLYGSNQKNCKLHKKLCQGKRTATGIRYCLKNQQGISDHNSLRIFNFVSDNIHKSIEIIHINNLKI